MSIYNCSETNLLWLLCAKGKVNLVRQLVKDNKEHNKSCGECRNYINTLVRAKIELGEL